MINILSKEVYNRISAGEVVENPASVVKELFENAVDSGATEITIHIENGGIDKILVLDNGYGIPKEDLPKVFLPHATSKISKAEDLENIETLGFRGEALASISSVAKCKIVTKIDDEEIGYKITCDGGVLGEITETSCKEGTAVYVTDLFYNTPARLKFLKTPKGEERNVTALVEKLILTNPYILVKYFIDGKPVLNSFGEGFKDVVLSVYGSEALNNSYEIKTEKNGLLIEGYLGSTTYTKTNRNYQTIVVNGRWITDPTISSAIMNAYSSYLMKRRYPFYILSITMPSQLVDVNVHPRKAEVRFQDNQVIYATVYSVVSKVIDGTKQALDIVVKPPSNPIIFDDTPISLAEIHSKPKSTLEMIGVPENELTDEQKFKLGYTTILPKINQSKNFDANQKEYVVPKPIIPDIFVAEKKEDKPPVKDFSNLDEELEGEASWKQKSNDIFRENKEYIAKLEREKRESQQETMSIEDPLRVVGQALKTYLILECGSDILIVDQHAAHERILYDDFCARVKADKVIKQQMLVPYTFKINPSESDDLFDKMQYFRELGFDLEEYEDDVFRFYALPVEFAGINLENFVRDILADKVFKQDTIPGVLRDKIIQKACKSAIKSGDKLTTSEIDRLILMIKKNWGLKCPHGRPICVRITRMELDKWFKRIV